jgi:hypothetical protein
MGAIGKFKFFCRFLLLTVIISATIWTEIKTTVTSYFIYMFFIELTRKPLRLKY